MNSNQENTTSSTGSLRLPQPDPDNITVLAHNLPSKPILPWNCFDYSSVNKESNQLEQTSHQKLSRTDNMRNLRRQFAAYALISSSMMITVILLLLKMNRNTPIDEKQENQETT
ncbi:hypothetical protein NIES4103_24290 [Nostoc sp. NIES-4103]|nr:hypothetical protein NIES4103_24290 [Nostoc sp. NIES-4103]